MKKILIIIGVIVLFLFFIIFFLQDDCGADYDCAIEKFGSLSFESNKAHSEII